MLEDVFESFLGATCQILDSKARIGVGYCVCYQILKYICDSKVISDEFTVLVDKEGKIIKTNVRGEELELLLKNVFGF